MITLDSLELPEGLSWVDEFSPQKVRQSVTHSIGGGKQFIQSQLLIINRSITLSDRNNSGWITRAVLLQLYALADSSVTHTLMLHDGRSFEVRWDYQKTPISADLIKIKQEPELTDFYKNVVLMFIQV